MPIDVSDTGVPPDGDNRVVGATWTKDPGAGRGGGGAECTRLFLLLPVRHAHVTMNGVVAIFLPMMLSLMIK